MARLARMETQYRALVAETTGRECTLEVAISLALPLIEDGFSYMSEGEHGKALGAYGDAIKVRKFVVVVVG